MSRAAQFRLAYDGPALRAGAMDVNELASSLLAVGQLAHTANEILNGERTEVSVRVKSDFKSGSFEVGLLLDQSLLAHAKDLLFPTTTFGAGALVALLFGTEAGKKGLAGAIGNVLDLWKKLKAEKPKEVIKDEGRGITIIVSGDGNKFDVDARVAALYDEPSVRSAVAGVARPVGRPGIKTLEIRKGNRTINQLQKSDLPPSAIDQQYEVATSASTTERSTREAVLRVTKANFEKGKWGFSDGAAHSTPIFAMKISKRGWMRVKSDFIKATLYA